MFGEGEKSQRGEQQKRMYCPPIRTLQKKKIVQKSEIWRDERS